VQVQRHRRTVTVVVFEAYVVVELLRITIGKSWDSRISRCLESDKRRTQYRMSATRSLRVAVSWACCMSLRIWGNKRSWLFASITGIKSVKIPRGTYSLCFNDFISDCGSNRWHLVGSCSTICSRFWIAFTIRESKHIDCLWGINGLAWCDT